MNSDWARTVRKKVASYDPIDLASLVGGLQLIPRNAGCLLRLEALADVIATIHPEAGKPHISQKRLRRICNTPPLRTIEYQEDPSEQPFTESVSFIGGAYTVFPGLIEKGTFHIRHLARMISIHYESFPAEFITEATHLFGVSLTLSDIVASAASLVRNTAPISIDRDVYVPSSSNLRELQSACKVDYSLLENELRLKGFDIAFLSRLCIQLGESSIEDFSIIEGSLTTRPIIRHDRSIILAGPGLLLAAIRHELLRLSDNYGVTSLLARTYRQVLWQTVQKSLEFIGHKPINRTLPASKMSMPIQEGLFSLDTDKALYASLTTDGLKNIDLEKISSHWPTDGVSEQIELRQLEIEDHVLTNFKSINEIMFLHLITSLGRSYSIGFGAPLAPHKFPRLSMSPYDLEIISLVEKRDPLLLFKYAVSSHAARDETDILSFSALDEFYLYRNNQYSYYVSDRRKPKFISISPGTSLSLVLEAVNGFDIHAVPSHIQGKVIEVMRVHPKSMIPIYSSLELAMIGEQIAYVVEFMPVYVWVIGPDFSIDPKQRELTEIYLHITDTIAYWIWQFSQSLRPILSSLENARPVIVLDVMGDPYQEWHAPQSNAINQDIPIAEYSIDEKRVQIINLSIYPALLDRLARRDNQGERELMKVVLDGICDLLQLSINGQEHSRFVEGILETYAPIGRKKKFLNIDISNNLSLSPTNPGPPRKVQMSDKTLLLDEVGEHLSQKLHLPIGPISNDDRTSVLEEMVDFFFFKVEQIVSSVDPKNLLEWLIRQNESILHDQSFRQLTIPTGLLCFGEEGEFIQRITNEISDLNEAGQTSRFIIEYVSAKPPTGLRPMSWSIYDRLQALSSEIILWAGISDLVHFRIAEIHMAVLESGRIGSDYQAFLDKTIVGFEEHTLEQIDQAIDHFDLHWPTEDEGDNHMESDIASVDIAFEAEYGYSLTDLNSLMSECFRIGSTMDSVVKERPSDELVNELSASTGFTEEKVNQIVGMLSLEPRNVFLDPPSPYRKEDVYPWRFGRPMSYIMRPLISSKLANHDIFLWGNLNLISSMKYIVGRCMSGRFQAKANSTEMRSLSAAINKKRGDKFNADVKKHFDTRNELVVDSEVLKIGGSRLTQDGNNLGDIDVLVIHPSRKLVLLVECKDLSVAKNPYEMANEIAKIFKGNHKPSTIERIERRQEWVKNNIRAVLSHFSLLHRGRWNVRSIMVVSEEMLTPYIQQCSTPIISFRNLRKSRIEDVIEM